MFHTKKGLPADWLAVRNLAGGMWENRAWVPAAITPYPQWAAEPGVHCHTVLQWVKLHVMARKVGRTWYLAGAQPAFFLTFSKFNAWQKWPSLHLSWVATQVVWGVWANNRNQETQTMAAQLRAVGPEGQRSQTQLQVWYCLVYQARVCYRKTGNMSSNKNWMRTGFGVVWLTGAKHSSDWLAGQQWPGWKGQFILR